MTVTIKRTKTVADLTFDLVKAWGPQGLEPKVLGELCLLLNPKTNRDEAIKALPAVIAASAKVKTKQVKAAREALSELLRASFFTR